MRRHSHFSRSGARVRRDVGLVIAVSTLVFFLVLAAVIVGAKLAAAGRIDRIEKALQAGDADRAARLIAALDDEELRRDYEAQYQYMAASQALEAGDFDGAAALFTALGSYKDAADQRREAILRQGRAALEAGNLDAAIRALEEIPGHADAESLLYRARYEKADALARAGDAAGSFLLFHALGDYADARDRALSLAEILVGSRDLEAALAAAEGLTPEAAARREELARRREALPRGIVAVGFDHTVALKSDGTVLACGSDEYGQCDVADWRDVTAVCAGAYHTVALRADGTVLAAGRNTEGQCGAADWRDMVAVAAADYATFGLRADGTVVWCGYNDYSMVDDWTDVTAISGGSYALAGLRSDSSAVFTHESGRSGLMRDLADVGVSTGYSALVRTDGTVVFAGEALPGWVDILTVAAGPSALLGLRADGTVAARFFRDGDEQDFSSLRDVTALASGGTHYAFVLADGSVVAFGDDAFGQCDTGQWDLF